MPEIKRNFVKGKMNKDLDERIVQNGEYRDALNIEIATSDGSDVGTIQNIAGNTRMTTTNDMYCGSGVNCYASELENEYDVRGCTTVGVVTNSSKDTVLWLQTGGIKGVKIKSSQPREFQVLEFDRILEYNPSTTISTPVFVDNFRTKTKNYLAAHTPHANNTLIIATLGISTTGVRPGMTVKAFNGSGQDIWRTPGLTATFIHEDAIVTVKNVTGSGIELEVTNHLDGSSWTEDTWSGGIKLPINTEIIFEADKVLNFDKDR